MAPDPDADTLLLGGTIRADSRVAPAEALLIRGGRIVAIGTEAEVNTAAARGTRAISLGGATVTAGFTDSHVHLTTWALARRRVGLAGAESIAAAVARVARAAPAANGWIQGQGWHGNRWDRAPRRSDLDAAVPGVPVFLDSHDLHAAWLNSEALRRCGISRATGDPPGGRIERDPDGEPTGILLENARARAIEQIPPPAAAEIRSALLAAQSEAHARGLTAVHSVESSGLRDFSAMEADGVLRLRVLQHIQFAQLDEAITVGLRSGFGGDLIRIGGVKIFLDGSLGSRTAWLREPYAGSRGDRGVAVLPREEFRDAVRLASRNGLASTVHAIGDAAVELALDVLAEIPPPPALAHRIEHVQLCPPDLWERAGRSGIVGSVQPVHLLTDIPFVERYWGDARARGAYPFRSLLDAGMVLAFGSDAPVEDPDPRPGLFAATARGTRADYDAGDTGFTGWHPEQRLTCREAVAGYTEGPALAAGWADRRGRLLPAFDADLVAWNRDPLTTHPCEFEGMECLLTMAGGEVVHRTLQ